MKRIVAIVIAVTLITATWGMVSDRATTATTTTTVTTATKSYSTSVERMPGIVNAINRFRVGEHLPPVHLDSRLNHSAQTKANDIISKHYWSHVASDGTPPWTLIRGAHYRYSEAGENLARCYKDAASVVTAWINSPAHREVLAGPYSDLGIGVAHDAKCMTIVAHFGSTS